MKEKLTNKVLGAALVCLMMASTLGALPSTVHAAKFSMGNSARMTGKVYAPQAVNTSHRSPILMPASPAGQGKIAFRRDVNGSSEIAVINPDGSGLTSLAQRAYGPAWSPDGTKIAFFSQRDGNEEIYVMNANGTGVTRITESPEWEMDPAWTPDGTKIAFARVPPLWQGLPDIWVMNADGSGQIQLTDHPDEDRMPTWSPDGTKIAFVSYREGGDIWVMNADGSGQTNLIDDSDWEFIDEGPAWSPDGSKIAFAADREKRGGRDIYIIDPDGSNMTRLTTPIGDNGHSSWSPDGTKIAFASNRDGNYEIYVMNADGTNETRITYDPVNESGPSWGIAADTGMIEEEPDIGPVSPIDFGNVILGSSLDKTTTIYNDGNATLTINGITSSGSSDFAYISPSIPFNIGASSSQTITISFAPESEGAKDAIFDISSNDPDEANVTLHVSGSGVTQTGTINVTSEPSGASFALSGPANYSGITPWSTTDAPVGTYTITWAPINGYPTPPQESKTLTQDETISFYGPYQLGRGTIEVASDPSGASFTLSGPANYSGVTPWSVTDAPAGNYTVTWGFMTSYQTPQAESKTLTQDGTISFYVTYPTVLAHINSYNAKPREVVVGNPIELSFSFTNAGDVSWTFYAAVSLRKPNGEEVHLPPKPVSVQPGEDGSATWSDIIDMEGGWDLVFGIWKEQEQINSLGHTGWLDNYIVGKAPQTTKLVVTSPLVIEPQKNTYTIGETVMATFIVSNKGTASISLDILTVGGRDPDGQVADFDWIRDVTLAPDATYKYQGSLILNKAGDYHLFIAYYIENPTEGERAFLDENNWNTAIELDAGLSDGDRKWSLTAYLPQVKVTKWEITNLWEESTLHKFLNEVRSVSGYMIDSRIDIYVDDDEPVWLMEIRLIETKPSTGEVISVEVIGVPKVGPRHYSLHLQRFTFSLEKYQNYLTTLTEILLTYFGLHTIRLPATPEPPPKVAVTDIIITDKNINTVHITQSEAGQTLPEQLQTYEDAVVSWIDINNLNLAHLSSPGELRVYDSQDRVTGLVDGEVKEEIPNSIYDDQNKIVVIYLPSDTYRYEVVGTDEGAYGINIASVREQKVTEFVVTDVPTSDRAVHRYTVDWDALRRGEPSIGVQIDSDGDKAFEETKILQPPIASFVFSPISALASEEINFDASESRDVDGEIISYKWNFGDGTTSTGRLVMHAYSAPGEYIVTLAVLDNDGLLSTHSKVIQVEQRQGALPIWVLILISIVTGLVIGFGVWRRISKKQTAKR